MSSSEEALSLKWEDSGPCEVSVKATFPSAYVKRQYENCLKVYVSQANCPGFRRGKAPKSMVVKLYHEDIKNMLKHGLLREALGQFYSDTDREFLSVPDLVGEPPELEDGKDYGFEMKAFVIPAMELPKYKGMVLEKEPDKATEEEIKQQVEHLGMVFSEHQDVTEPAVDDDMVKISYKSDLQAGEEGKGPQQRFISAENTWCVLREPESLPGLNAALLGSKPGDKKKFTSEFPEDFHEASLAGKKVEYEVELITIQRRVPITDMEKLKEKIGAKPDADLLGMITRRIEGEKNAASRLKMLNGALEVLHGCAKDIEPPKEILDSFFFIEFENILNAAVRTKNDIDKFKEAEQEYRRIANERALHKLRTYLVCRAIASIEDIKVEKQDIMEAYGKQADQEGINRKQLKKYLERPGRTDAAHVDMLISRVADLIMQHAEIKEVPASEKDSSGDTEGNRNDK